MQTVELAAIDLNLLVALDALLAEGSVTRAAERVGLTQPAMSHALNRLRKLLDDPILVRTPRGMLPTPRAEELVAPIRRALGEIERALHHRPDFDPATATRTFTLSAVDFGEFLILPPLLARLRAEAPGVDLVVQALRLEEVLEQLEAGDVDLGIGVSLPPDLPRAYRQKLFDERFVCLVREGHPEVGDGPLSLEKFVSLSHALISPRGRKGGYVDRALEAIGLSRHVALMVPHFLVAPHVVAQSDLVLTLPARVGRAFADILPLRAIEPPLELASFTVTQFWHERQQKDPAHAWFRGLLVDVCRQI
jgi:DNA-binding transcriptional LysR family regulator